MAPLQLSYYPGKIAAVLKRGIKLASFRVETFYLFLFAPTSSASSANSSFLDRRSTSGYTDFSFSRSFSAMLPFALFVSIPRLEKKLLREKRADWRYKLLLTLVVYSTNLFFSFLFFSFFLLFPLRPFLPVQRFSVGILRDYRSMEQDISTKKISLQRVFLI